jgi:hypothetical protein
MAGIIIGMITVNIVTNEPVLTGLSKGYITNRLV